MISSRKFVVITIMMLVMFFLFQFTTVMKDVTNEYDKNTHIVETNYTEVDTFTMQTTNLKDKDYVVFIGSRWGSIGANVKQWCTYTKRNMLIFGSIDEYRQNNISAKPEMIVIQEDYTKLDTDTQYLKAYVEDGINLIFCNLPGSSVIKDNKDFMSLIGVIQMMDDRVEIQGLKLFSGFLLGGECIYNTREIEESIDTIIPWYKLGSGTKTYMVGLKEGVSNENLPAIIWRKSYDNASVFCVNGEYMSELMGIGFLQAMAGEMKPYEIYPVVNAQNLVVSSYPCLAAENEETMMQLYSRKLKGVFMDVVWPDLVALCKRNHYKMTTMIAPQMDYKDEIEPSDEELIDYLKQINEEDSEAGLSMQYIRNIPLIEKIKKDSYFLETTGIEYKINAMSVEHELLSEILNMMHYEILKNIRTITCAYEQKSELISYCAPNITLQQSTSTGVTHTAAQDLGLRAIQTALAYSNVNLNMKNVAWPTDSNDDWHIYYKGISKNVETYWKPFRYFTSTTLSESDARVRNFLAMDFKLSQYRDGVKVDISGATGDKWFLIKLNDRKIKSVTDGEYRKLEDGYYLIQTSADSFTIDFADINELYYK